MSYTQAAFFKTAVQENFFLSLKDPPLTSSDTSEDW